MKTIYLETTYENFYFGNSFLDSILFSQETNLNSTPFTFKFGQIPFGKPMEEVLKLVEGASVKEDEDVDISFIGDYNLNSEFSGGMYSILGMGSYFTSSVTKLYKVEYDKWENINQIRLYFVKSFGKDKNDYTLFFVTKEQKSSGGDYKNVYAGFKKSIIKILGVSPSCPGSVESGQIHFIFRDNGL